MREHTPWPWDNWGLTKWQQSDGRKICHLAGMSWNAAENKANTDLVKAAPELLAALENLMSEALEWADSVHFDRDASWESNAEPVIVAARAAIALATGVQA